MPAGLACVDRGALLHFVRVLRDSMGRPTIGARKREKAVLVVMESLLLGCAWLYGFRGVGEFWRVSWVTWTHYCCWNTPSFVEGLLDHVGSLLLGNVR
jgi:hypothetical protein